MYIWFIKKDIKILCNLDKPFFFLFPYMFLMIFSLLLFVQFLLLGWMTYLLMADHKACLSMSLLMILPKSGDRYWVGGLIC